MRFSDSMTLGEARSQLRELAYGGTRCPCCTRNVRVFRRKLTSVAARAIVALYEEHTLSYGHMQDVARKRLPDVAGQAGYLLLSQHFGLIEEERRRRPDGGRVGYWRVTPLGAAWLRGEETVPLYADIYDGRCLGLHGDLVTVQDVLGSHFNFAELVGAKPSTQVAIDPFDHQQEAA